MLVAFSGSWAKNGSIKENCGLYDRSTDDSLTFAFTFVILYTVVFGAILPVLLLPKTFLEFLKILFFLDRQNPCQIAPQGGREQPPNREETPHRPPPNPPPPPPSRSPGPASATRGRPGVGSRRRRAQTVGTPCTSLYLPAADRLISPALAPVAESRRAPLPSRPT